MLRKTLFVSGIIYLPTISANGHCIDINSKVVSQGLYYFPGPNPCTFCQCDKGSPKWCKSVLCSPPQNCKSFQLGNSCCEYKCLDDILTANDGYKDTYDLALRLVASAVTAILSLSLLFFLLHRLRRRKLQIRQNRQLNEDQRSLNSIGYIAGSLGYLSGNIGYLGAGNSELEYHYEDNNAHISLWKPRGNYFPRDEAPPPYEEAVRLAQAENETLNAPLVNEQPQVVVQPQCAQNSAPCPHERSYNNHEYANVNVHCPTVYQNCISGNIKNENKCEKSNSYENVINLRPENSSAQKSISRNLENQIRKHPHLRTALKDLHNERKVDKKSFYENVRHRTVPNLSDYQAKHKETNRQKPKQPKVIQIHRTLPSNLKELNPSDEVSKFTDAHSHRSLPKQVLKYETPLSLNIAKSQIKSQINLLENSLQTITHKASDAIASSASFRISPKEHKIKDDERAVSYQYQSSSQDEDDYRSECENCKSSGLAIVQGEDLLNETMTLQRRPPEQGDDVPYYRNSVTLPSDTRKPRAVNFNAGRESWFVTMPETSSSEDSE